MTVLWTWIGWICPTELLALGGHWQGVLDLLGLGVRSEVFAIEGNYPPQLLQWLRP
jgi:hypothetical protein